MASVQTVIVTLYLISAVLFLVAFFFGIIFIWKRKAIMDSFRLNQWFKRGYIIARLLRNDHSIIQIVTLPSQDNTVTFPGVAGKYVLDNASVNLLDRKKPEYTWLEGQCLAPMHYLADTTDTPVKIKCGSCGVEAQHIVKIKNPRSPSPEVLDNLIMKIKTLMNSLMENRLLLMIVILVIGGILFQVVNFVFVSDLKKHVGEYVWSTIGQRITDICTPHVVAAQTAIQA